MMGSIALDPSPSSFWKAFWAWGEDWIAGRPDLGDEPIGTIVGEH